jgi:DNA-binding transcriptional LysR family regulator
MLASSGPSGASARQSPVLDHPAPDWERVGRKRCCYTAGVQWDDLRVFLAVAQTGSLRRAARALHLGQPTVVRHVRQLEAALRARLFERSPDGHRLTRWGQDLLPLAQNMADTATAIDRRGATFAEEAGGLVRVMAHEWAARFLAPRLAALAEAHPDLTVELAETHVEPDLARREADLFVRHGLPSRGQLVRVALRSAAIAVYGTAELAAAHAAARTEARWRECPWVAYDTPHEYFRSMAWLAERMGERRPRVRANRVSLQLEAVRTGAGLGLLPSFVGDAEPTLAQLSAPIADLAIDYWLLYHPDLKTVTRVRRVGEWIRAAFRAARPELQGRRSAMPTTRTGTH